MKLLNTTANATGPVFYIGESSREDYRIVHVAITGTASVAIQGRQDDDMPWHTIKTYTATGADDMKLFPYMRAVASGVGGSSSAVVTVDATSL